MNTFRKYITLLSLSICYSSAYLVVYLKYILYNPMINTFGVSNKQFGFIMSMYAIGCILLYIPGGYVADKYSVRKILVYSLLGTSIICTVLAFTLSYPVALISWFLLAFTTAFAFWGALMKGALSLCDENDNGRVVSIYSCMTALLATGFNAFLIWLFSRYSNETTGLKAVILAAAALSFIAAILVGFLYKDKKCSATDDSCDKFEAKNILPLIKSPILWAVSLCIFTVYGMRVAGNTFFNPYLTNFRKIDADSISKIGVVRSYIMPLLSPIAGFMIDKVFKSTAKWLMFTFTSSSLSLILLMVLPLSTSSTVIIIVSLLPSFVTALMYGIMFAIVKEARIPEVLMGTAIGIISIVGYLPDFAYDPIFGSILDNFGLKGYNIIFTTLIILTCIGISTCIYIRRYVNKLDNNLVENISVSN